MATDWGAVEYAERGVGEPLPVLHGIFGGCDGVLFDAFVSNADVNTCELEAIRVPTLVAHTKDDPFASHEAGRRAAGRIPGARFVSLESGGHLMLGQTTIIHDELAEFFAENNRLR